MPIPKMGSPPPWGAASRSPSRHRQIYCPDHNPKSIAIIDDGADIDPLELADGLDLEDLDAAGDDRSEFNLGGGARWVPAAPIDE